MWGWLTRNAGPVEALGAIATALIALVALVGVKLQIDANAELQQAQAARDAYRDLLKIMMDKPELPRADFCALSDDHDRTAYIGFVEYALYTTEQVMAADPGWKKPMADLLAPHAPYLCQKPDWDTYPSIIRDFADELLPTICPATPDCG